MKFHLQQIIRDYPSCSKDKLCSCINLIDSEMNHRTLKKCFHRRFREFLSMGQTIKVFYAGSNPAMNPKTQNSLSIGLFSIENE